MMSIVRTRRVAAFAALLVCFSVLPHVAAAADTPIRIWMDVDTANGIGEIDDGLALVQAFHSPNLQVMGVSAIFGNAPLKRTFPIALNVARVFGPKGLKVYRGAEGPRDLGTPNAGTQAMAAALRRHRMTIVAIGPATDVATLIERHPALTSRIDRIVMVAGRLPGQTFISAPKQPRPFTDFNFENDPAAMQVVLDSHVPLVFAPWQVASKTWITRRDLTRLQASGGSGLWIAATSQQWIDTWTQKLHARGGNPFDTLAIGYLNDPTLFKSMHVRAEIDYGPGDQPGQKDRIKPYLVVHPANAKRSVVYLESVSPRFHSILLSKLAGPRGLPPNKSDSNDPQSASDAPSNP